MLTSQDPKEQFLQAVAALSAAHAGFRTGVLKPVQHADARGAALSAALFALAQSHGVLLQAPLQIDSRGEFAVTALKSPDANPLYGTGRFGAEFAARLTRHKARTGVSGPALFTEDSGWCKLNHFDAEALVLEYARELQPTT